MYFGQYYSCRFERIVDASQGFLHVLENFTFGCDHLVGYILGRCYRFHRRRTFGWNRSKCCQYFHSQFKAIHLPTRSCAEHGFVSGCQTIQSGEIQHIYFSFLFFNSFIDLLLQWDFFLQAQEIESIKICHYCGSLNFASRSNFKSEVLSLVAIDAVELTRVKPSKPIDINCIIIDFSALSYIDPSGVLALKQLINDFNRLNIRVYIAGASCKWKWSKYKQQFIMNEM